VGLEERMFFIFVWSKFQVGPLFGACPRRTGYLTSTELRDALHTCIKIAQQEIYTQEIKDLRNKGQVSSKSQLQPFHPYLDKEDDLGVGVRYSIHMFHTILNIN
jgi:hypothetical protein